MEHGSCSSALGEVDIAQPSRAGSLGCDYAGDADYFTDTFVRRLSRVEKEQMYLESTTWHRRYGVSDGPTPADSAAPAR